MTATIPLTQGRRSGHGKRPTPAATGAARTVAGRSALRVNPFVRAALYAYVLSIPFEWPNRTVPVEIPTLMGAVFLLATLVHPSACFRRIPSAGLWFVAHLWVLAIAGVANTIDHPDLTVELFVWFVQVVLLFWVTFNLLADERVLRGVLLALVAGCIIRAGMQVFGIAATGNDVWTGGQRLTVLGQNANLSAIILAAGLAAAVGLRMNVAGPPLRRLSILAWPFALVIGTAIIQTGSRGGLLCAGMGIATYLFTGRTVALRMRNGMLGLLAVGLLGWGAYRSDVMRGRVEAAEAGQLAGREKIYPALLAMLRERPVLGWGPVDNQFEIARRIDEHDRPRRDAHNLALEVLTTSGLVGGLPFLAGLALCIRGAWRARRGPLGVLPLAILGAVLTGTVTGTWIVAKIVWLALALALAAGAHWTPSPSQTPASAPQCAV